MKQEIVTTNLRLPREDWLQVKTEAAEEGISFNERVKNIIWECGTRQQLIATTPTREKKKKYTIWELGELAKIKDKPMGMSEEDKVIYG